MMTVCCEKCGSTDLIIYDVKTFPNSFCKNCKDHNTRRVHYENDRIILQYNYYEKVCYDRELNDYIHNG